MSPNEFAQQVEEIIDNSEIAARDSSADVELAYLIIWAIGGLWNMRTRWTAEMAGALMNLYNTDSDELQERMEAYDEAAGDDSGGGPMYHMTSTFQSYVGEDSFDVMGNMAAAATIGAILSTVRDGIIACCNE